jgi:hypothetical protein
MNYTSVSAPAWANAEHTAINCLVNFEGLGEVPFTAAAVDQYPYVVTIFNQIVAGNYGAIAEFVPLPTPSVRVVDMAQARLALLAAGHLATVNAAIAAMTGPQGDAARIEWEFRARVRRDSALTQTMAATLGLSETDLDELFATAATL